MGAGEDTPRDGARRWRVQSQARESIPAIAMMVAIVSLASCSAPKPRYGEATLSSASPRATLTGTTWGEAAALELAPGCPGYLDPAQPAHVVHVSESIAVHLRARSDRGPIALAVARGDEVRCDSDGGDGHAPSLTFQGAGDYLVYVAALRAPAELPYTLTVGASEDEADAPAAPTEARDVTVTITSEPSGASVHDAEGHVVGTTPAMFVVSLPPGAPADRSWTLELEGHQPATVTGALATAALVLHAQLSPNAPTEVSASASDPQPIRDYRSATLAVDVTDECTIASGEVEVDIRHSFIGDLRVALETPWGDELTLHRHGGGGRHDLRRTWSTSDAALRAIVGHSTRGRWSLVVHDDAGADEGSLDRFDLRLRCGDATPIADAEPVEHEEPSSHVVPRAPRLPDLPTHADIVTVLARLRPSIEQRCAQGGGNVRVYFTVRGSTGAVQHSSVSGTASQAEQTCVGNAVRAARFPRFRRDSLDVDYTYDLPARRPSSGGALIAPFVQPR